MLKFKVESRSLDCLGISTLFRVLVTSTSVSCNTSVCWCMLLQCQGRRKRHRSSKVPLGDLRCETNRWHQVTLIDTLSWAIDTYWHFVFFSNLFKSFQLSWAIWAKVRLATEYAQSLTVWGAAENTSKIEDQGTDIRHQKSNAVRCTSWINMHRHSDGSWWFIVAWLDCHNVTQHHATWRNTQGWQWRFRYAQSSEQTQNSNCFT